MYDRTKGADDDHTEHGRSGRARTLGENFGLGRYETDDGLRLTFKDHPAVQAELQALVAVENECCSWAAWSIERGKDGALVMAARSQDDGIAALHGMFTSATPWSRRQHR